ncbi:ATP-binding protein [Nonomuraea sp. NPDC050556]|uniref:ATP-binding protein n=1 Tax=Nonomuraea sp. NPDC050556 TaxID=3364369 RepID=UPI0037A4E1D6
MSPLDVLVLGPAEVRAEAVAVRVDRPLERALLVRLALAAGAPVPDNRLAADLWGEVELARPTERLRVLASRMRAALPSGAVLRRTPGGYALDAVVSDLAAARTAADRVHAAARSGDHPAAREAAVEAAGLWRGPSLGDLRAIPFAAAEGERLEAWRLDLLVERLSADLSLGAGPEVGAELERLAAEHPLHERVCCLLALSLYRGGRQADALDRIARLRRKLADELGVDPAPETAAMELRLLRQDPDLLPAPQAAAPAKPVARAARDGFVGREADLAALVERLSGPGLVTLTGGPGSGKSRLSVEAAAVLRSSGRAVTLVELAPLRSEGSVRSAVLAAAGADDVAGCAAALDGAVLVVDNAEHLVDEVADLVAALLAEPYTLTVLATSQRPLLVAGEEVHRVGPLGPAAAAQLFELRCAPDQAGADPGAVATICAAVDRLPLGVELAAGLTRALTVAQLSARVNDRLRLLVGGRRDAGGRHSSLRAALDWSHDLLDERERTVLRRASVFSGGFTLEAAEQVLADELLLAEDVAPALAELADRSLVAVETGAGRRFLLLETVRDYALDRLGAADEGAAVQARHLSWCVEFVRGATDDDFASADSVNAVFAEWPNLLAALEAAPGTPRAADGLRLALELHTPWQIKGWYGESRRHFAALASADGATPGERLEALSAHGFVTTMVGDFEGAAALLETAAELAAEVGDDRRTMTVLYYRGIVEIERGRLREAFPPLLAGQELAVRLEHRQRMSAFADALATLHLYCGDAAEALAGYRLANEADRAAGDEHGLARGLSNEGQALLAMGRYGEAVELADASDHYALRLDDRQILPLNEQTRGVAALCTGDLAAAERHLRAAVDYAVTDGTGASMANIDLADLLIGQGAFEEARALLDPIFAEAPAGSTPWLAARPVAAALALAVGDLEGAAELAESTAAAHAASGFGWPRYTGLLADVRERLSQG